ncbi:hypothetical protein [Gemmata sp.]|uniref:hypothetical protein n=1 Tax=Gemmata sp. TaxID=1914242 RepID=UPI003F6FE38D
MRSNAFVLVAALAAAGCGGEKLGRVTGTVTAGGKPVTSGTVQFIPVAGKAAVASIMPDGTYSLTTYAPADGALVGTHKVVIHSTRVGGGKLVEAKSIDEEIKLAKNDSGKILVPGKVEWVVPERYSAPASTDLTATVAPGEQTINFDVPAK